MSDLDVDRVLLGETAGSLGMLIAEFERAARIVEDAEPAIGRNVLLEEMRAFVDEWTHTREQLLTSLQAVLEAATASREAFGRVDDELARAIRTADEGGR